MFDTISSMKQRDQRGNINSLLLPLVIAGILFIGTAVFAVWAFTGMQDYKDNVDTKITTANAEVKKTTQLEEASKYAEEAKNPFQVYNGPSTFGNVKFDYPKTWSVYQASTGSDDELDVYFNPGIVPATTDTGASYALRFKIVNQKYSDALTQFSVSDSSDGSPGFTVAPYQVVKVGSVIGTRIDGQIDTQKQGVMIILPIRDKTLQIWTESATYLADFNDKILPSLTFVP